MGTDYETVVLAIKERFEDDPELIDSDDITFLLNIVNMLEDKNEMLNKIIREGRHIIEG